MLAAERLMIWIILALGVSNAALIAYKGISLDYGSYTASLIFAMLFVVVGLFYRFVRSDDRISTLALAIGLFAVFSLVMSLYSQVLLPHRWGPFDSVFVEFDALLGFSWPAVMALGAEYPAFAFVLGIVYDLALAFVLLSLLLLALVKGYPAMHELILSFMLAAITTILLWSVVPAAGAAAFWPLSPEIDQIVNPRVDMAYSLKLLELYQTGFQSISDITIKGLIGFPSFHTVMYVLPTIYLMQIQWVRWPVLVFAVLGLISVAVQGGHHLSDVLGGIACSFVGIVIARRLLRYKGLACVQFRKQVKQSSDQLPAAAE